MGKALFYFTYPRDCRKSEVEDLIVKSNQIFGVGKFS